MRSRPDGPPLLERRPSRQRRFTVEALETYTSVLAILSVALLLVAAGMAKKQLVWKVKPVSARRRRRP
jgi:hypothetical protein